MSLVPGNIKVDFIANYVGDHRVCYRQGDSGPYTCITTACSTLGACEGIIPIFVENESCEAVVYNGYVQASCIPADSIQDRVLWTVTFTPSPACHLYKVTCATTSVMGISIINGGSGYDFVDPPLVEFAGGGGHASAQAIVGTGAISFLSFSSHGDGYVDGTYSNVAVTGGTGTGAKAQVVISGQAVTSIAITIPGTGYLSTDSLGLNSSDLGSSPTIPVVFKALSDRRVVIGITGLTSDILFTSVPVVLFSGGAGSGAAATAVMTPCPQFTSTGCSGDPVVIAAGVVQLAEYANVCGYSKPPANITYYDIVQDSGSCLCGCVSANIFITGTVGQTVRYTYNKCGLEVRTGILTVGGSPSSIIDCIAAGSLVFQSLSSAQGNVTYLGDCS